MEEEATDEFLGGKGHRFLLASVSIVLVSEAHLTVFDVQQAVVRDGYAMGIAADIVEHLFGSGEGRVWHRRPTSIFRWAPDSGQTRGDPGDRSRAEKNWSLPESKALWRRSRNRRRNRRDKTRTGKKNRGLQETQRVPSGESPPPGTTQCRCGMMHQVRPPGVQDGEEADLRAEVFGIGGYGTQGFGRGLEENAVDHLLVLVGDRGNLVRHREDDVEVLAVEKFGLAVFDPLGAGQRLALGAMAIRARPVANALMPALHRTARSVRREPLSGTVRWRS